MFWCKDHIGQCEDLAAYSLEQDAKAHTTLQQDTPCSTLPYDVESISLNALQALFQRSQFLQRKQDGLLCEDFQNRLRARLTALESQVAAETARKSEERERVDAAMITSKALQQEAKARQAASKVELAALQKEIARLKGTQMDAESAQTAVKAELATILDDLVKQAADLARLARERVLVASQLEQITALRKQTTTVSTKSKSKKGKNKGKAKAAQISADTTASGITELTRAELLDDLKDQGRNYSQGKDPFEYLLLAAWIRLVAEGLPFPNFGGDIFDALDTAPGMSDERLRKLSAQVANPSNSLIQEGLRFEKTLTGKT
ncbi:hypothetical protein HKX48_000295 [Thoreauomyces humboldtii]|nr:hypothetical protein HKX48_000295 [Thoreauomyces humboldtii]